MRTKIKMKTAAVALTFATLGIGLGATPAHADPYVSVVQTGFEDDGACYRRGNWLALTSNYYDPYCTQNDDGTWTLWMTVNNIHDVGGGGGGGGGGSWAVPAQPPQGK